MSIDGFVFLRVRIQRLLESNESLKAEIATILTELKKIIKLKTGFTLLSTVYVVDIKHAIFVNQAF